jgi:ribonuclease T1
MSQGRVRALIAGIVAIAAVLGIALPGGGDDGSTSAGTSSPNTAAQTTSEAATNPGPSSGPSATSEEGVAIAGVLAAIDAGTPSRYSEDGGTFENREGLLPDKPFGYYREYTVETPGSPDRGARRLVIGEDGDTWYTNDHYASFTRIDPEAYQ